MAHHPAHQQHIQWLEAQLAQEKQELTVAEDKLAEVEALVLEKRESVAYFQRAIEALGLNHLGKAQGEEIKEENSEEENFDGEELEEEAYEDEEFDNLGKRNPKDMLRSDFSSLTLGDAAEKILAKYSYPLNPEQIADKMFEPKSEDERLRARNSLATELRRGAKDGRWQKIGRALFLSNDIPEENFSMKIEELSRFHQQINNGSILDS